MLEFKESCNHHALSSEGNMTPNQLLFEGLNHVIQISDYTVTVPSLDEDIDVSQLTGEHVIVPRISFVPCTVLAHDFHSIDPLLECSDHGKMLYRQPFRLQVSI